MGELFISLIREYLHAVSDAVLLFRTVKGVRGNLLMACHSLPVATSTVTSPNSDTPLPPRGILDCERGITYAFHGIGCCVKFGSTIVDFDFGPQGRHDGFDAWRLHCYAESVEEYHEFDDVDLIQSHLDQLEFSGRIVKESGGIASHLYYFVNPDDNAFYKRCPPQTQPGPPNAC